MMQRGEHLGFCIVQVDLQNIGKQMVIAIPDPLIVERNHKKIAPL